jgi:hypothetical protein
MPGRRFGRAWTAGTLVVGAALAGTLFLTGPASATATATAEDVTCSSLNGNLSTSPATFTLGGCTGDTGGSGTAQGETISWANGKATYLLTPAFSVKDSSRAKQGNCSSLADKYPVKNVVAGDTTGSMKVDGKVSAEVCILNEAPDPWSLAPRSVFTLR